jgi:hypothetical protein
VSLQGSFETIALSDVMALLAASAKSGELRVVSGHVEGRLWLQHGQIVASNVGRTDDYVDALFELLRLTEGNFVFRDGVDPPEPADPSEVPVALDVEPVLRQAQARLAEWKDIVQVVPSAEHRVHLVAELPAPEVTLSAEDWQMVMAVALAGSVQGVLEELHRGQFDGFRGIRRLVEAGLVEVEPPRVRTTGSRVGRRLLDAVASPEPAAPAAEPVAEYRPDEPVVEDRPVELAPALVFPAIVAGPDESVSWQPAEPEEDRESDVVVIHVRPAEPEFFEPVAGHEEPEEPAEAVAAAGGAPAGGDAINRGLLLKFLSSVRS